jgi:outer membrane protein
MRRAWHSSWSGGFMRCFSAQSIIGSVTIVVAIALQPALAAADTLFGAMEKAYATNPSLNAARAGQRATDELVPQALSGWRPTITVQGAAQSESLVQNDRQLSGRPLRQERIESGSLSIVLNQPVFQGFRTVESTKAAEAQVDAGRQSLLQTEQQVLFDVVQAYMDVYAGRQLVVLRRQDVAALQTQVTASNERFAVGEITRTDVAQSEARLAQSQNALVEVQTRLARDVARYIQLVGNEPGKLSYPKIASLPKSLAAALEIAGDINPRLLAQAFVEVAANSNIGVARSGLLPSAGLVAEALTADVDFSKERTGIRSATIGAQLSIPIYEAGFSYSQVRQAKQRASQSRIQLIEIARDVRSAVAQSWNTYLGLGQIIRNTKTQVQAAQLALTGVQQEYQAGTRTTLDVLDAQRELVQSQVLQVDAEKSRVVAGYQLLASIGRLTARDIGLKVPIYDPEENYRRVRDKWIGTDVKTVD